MMPSIVALPLAAAEIPTPTAALVTFIVYSIAVVLLAVASQVVLQKRAFLQEYFLGSRNLGWIAFTLTFAATSASAGSFGGFPALVYNHGWVLGFWIAGYMAVPLISLGLMGKRLNRISKVTGAITMPELIGLRFPGFAVRIATGMIIVLLSIYLVPQFKMAGVILQSLLHDFAFWQSASNALQQMTSDLPMFQADDPGYLLGLLVFSSMVIVYTSLGGFRAVVWTDVLQGIVMLFGVMGLLLLTLKQVGGLGNATQTLAKMEPPRLGKAIFYTASTGPQVDPIRVPMDSWFETSDGRLFRTNATAYIDQKSESPPSDGTDEAIVGTVLASPEIKTVEIQGDAEKERIRNQLLAGQVPALPPGVEVKLLEFDAYAYGAGRTGVYTTAPGPSFKSSAGFLPLSLAFSFFLFWSIGGSGQPSNMVRQMSFDRVRTLKRSMVFLTFYFGAIYFPLVLIFVCGRVLVPDLIRTPINHGRLIVDGRLGRERTLVGRLADRRPIRGGDVDRRQLHVDDFFIAGARCLSAGRRSRCLGSNREDPQLRLHIHGRNDCHAGGDQPAQVLANAGRVYVRRSFLVVPGSGVPGRLLAALQHHRSFMRNAFRLLHLCFDVRNRVSDVWEIAGV
ncbi:MAG: hypothetical protein R3C05_19440 [Pirellulaceae bacterium]